MTLAHFHTGTAFDLNLLSTPQTDPERLTVLLKGTGLQQVTVIAVIRN